MRILVAGLLGAIAMFIWASIAHGLTTITSTGLKAVPNEAAVMQDLQQGLGNNRGLYFFPYAAGMRNNAKAVAASPTGIIAYNPPAAPAMVRQLGVEFVLEFIEALLTAVVIAAVAAGFGHRLAMAAAIGAVAAISTNFSYWNWYGFSFSYTLANAFTELMKFVFAGAAIAAFLRWRATKPA
jgi:hypothetical protein